MDIALFVQLSIVLVVAAAVSALMRLLRQPLLIGYIITGIVLGPALLHVIGNGEQAFSTFGSLGIALLLFIIGLELNADIIRRLGRVVLLTAAAQIIATALIGGLVVLAFGLPVLAAGLIGLGLSFSSTIIIVKTLNDKREQSQLYGQITIGVTLLQDIVASVALIFLTNDSHGFSMTQGALLVSKGVVAIAGLALLSLTVLPRAARFIASSQEFLFLFALAWGFGVAGVFALNGFSLAVGALAAGVSLASLPYAQEMAAKLKPLRDFFVVIFFVTLGGGLQLGDTLRALPLALALILVVMAVKPLATFHAMGLLAYTKRTSFKTAVALGQLSEFALIFIVLAIQNRLVPPETATLLTLVALVSIAISTYVTKYDDRLFAWFDKNMTMFERKVVTAERSRRRTEADYRLVLFGYHKGGTEFIKTFQLMHEPYVVIDYDPEVIKKLAEQDVPYKYGDADDPELLEDLGAEKIKFVASTITSFEVNHNLVRHIHRLNARAAIVCHAENSEQAGHLYNAGATYVMLPHIASSQRLGSIIRRHGAHKHVLEPYRQKQQADLIK